MMKPIRVALVTLIALALVLPITVTPSAAHPGNTDSRGGHTCRTNCASWGLGQGQYHFHGRPGPAPITPPVEAPLVPQDSSSGLSDAIGAFFYNGGIVAILGALWLYSKYKKQ